MNLIEKSTGRIVATGILSIDENGAHGPHFMLPGNFLETHELVDGPAPEAADAYQAKRAAEYPPMTDYLDGIVKGDQSQVQAYIDACLAVKAKYPKHI